MSVDAHRWVTAVLLDPPHRIGRTARAVLRELAEHHNATTGRCSPSHARLAALVGVHPGNVRRALAELADVGLIDWAEVPGRRCAYRFATAELAAEVVHTPRAGAQGAGVGPRALARDTPRAGARGPRALARDEPEEEPERTAPGSTTGAATLTGGAGRYPNGEPVPAGGLIGPAAAIAAGLVPLRVRSGP